MTDSLRQNDRSPAAEQLLARARRGTEPSLVDERRVRSRLHARVLAAPLLLGARSAHAFASASKLSAAKLLLALGVCGGTAVVAGVALKHGFGAQNQAPSGARVLSSARPAAAQPAPLPAPIGRAQLADSVPQIEVPAPIVAVPVPVVKRPASGASPVLSLSPQDMQLEIAGLQRAQQLLHAGSAAQAVTALDQLARQVPLGALMEERDATRVIALCTLGRAQAAGVDAFLARYPNSVHSGRVRTACSRASFQ
jgi:hypothetical protein